MKILDLESDLILKSSHLLQGEQVFTSLLVLEGKILFLEDHLNRLIKGASFLFPEGEWEQKRSEISAFIVNLISKCNFKNIYCRPTIIGDYFFCLLKEHTVTNQALIVKKAFQIKTPSLRPNYLKIGQYADSLMEIKQVQKLGAQDILYFDSENFLTESSTSNVFVVNHEGKLLTAPLSSMVLDGILRSKICSSISVIEKNISEGDLLDAREIWLTNSLKGIRFVNQFESMKFERASSLYNLTIKNFGRYGEKIGE